MSNGPCQTVRDWLRAGARIVAAGKTTKQAAKLLGRNPKTFYNYRRTHPEFWQAELAVAIAELQAQGIDTDRQPTEEIQQQIRRATALIAAGRSRLKTAEELGVCVERVNHFAIYYRSLWQQELDRAMEAAATVVRRDAGTARVLEDPHDYLKRASRCEKWAKQKGNPLFPVNGEATLTSFFETWYAPIRMHDAIPQSVEMYRYSLRRWRLITGDPPLKEITVETLSHFRDALERMPGQKPGSRSAVATVRRHLTHIQCILNKAAKPGWRNRDAAGVIDTAPWIRKPRLEYKEPQVVSIAHLEATYRAAATMTLPKIPGVEPADWWRCLLVVTYNLALRRRTLFELTWDAVDFEKRILVVPPASMKAHRLHVTHLNPTAIDHLARIRTDRKFVFAWSQAIRQFHVTFHKLQDAAGIPPESHFGLHGLRRTSATLLWQQSPEAAMLSLGHSTMQVTQDHYVNQMRVIAPALEKLPQPEAFTQGTC